MPWEITIRTADGSPLGERDMVRERIRDAFPGVQFYWEPSGLEKIAAFRATGQEFPDIIRKHLERTPSKEQGDFEQDEFSVRSYLQTGPTIEEVDADVRGESKRVFPHLQRLATMWNWVVAECGREEPFIE
jgi:hypothetical protein